MLNGNQPSILAKWAEQMPILASWSHGYLGRTFGASGDLLKVFPTASPGEELTSFQSIPGPVTWVSNLFWAAPLMGSRFTRKSVRVFQSTPSYSSPDSCIALFVGRGVHWEASLKRLVFYCILGVRQNCPTVRWVVGQLWRQLVVAMSCLNFQLRVDSLRKRSLHVRMVEWSCIACVFNIAR